MSNKLLHNENIKSVNAINDYLRHNGKSVLQKDVVVIKNGELLISDKINVLVSDRNTHVSRYRLGRCRL